MKKKPTPRRQHKWSIYVTILAVLIGSSIIFLSMFNITWESVLMRTPLLGEDIGVTDADKKKVQEVYETVGVEHKDIGGFISKTHEFYNKTTGYGAINKINWDEQVKEAEMIVKEVNRLLPGTENSALKKDLHELQDLAEQVLANQDLELIKKLHRVAHDLDIALNDYEGYDKIWNVTETLK